MGADKGKLLEAWKAGDREAGGKLLASFEPMIRRFFSTKVDAQNAEELTQATLESCVAGRKQIAGPEAIRAFLYGIARFKLLQHHDLWRRRGARIHALDYSVESARTSASGAVARAQMQQLVQEALCRLPMDMRIAVELRYGEGLPLAEVAQALEIPVGTAKSRLHRARSMLKERVETLVSSPDAMDAETRAHLREWVNILPAFEGGARSPSREPPE